MTEKVDQDVREAAADYADEHIRLLGLGDDIVAGKKDDTALVQAFARMKEAGRQAGLMEAAEALRPFAEAGKRDLRDHDPDDMIAGIVDAGVFRNAIAVMDGLCPPPTASS